MIYGVRPLALGRLNMRGTKREGEKHRNHVNPTLGSQRKLKVLNRRVVAIWLVRPMFRAALGPR